MARPKKKSEELFQLIRSLSGSEKRYFMLFSQRHVIGEENNYIRLFKAMEQQKEYDEAAIIRAFQGETFVKQLHRHKNYLFELILRSLAVFHSKRTVESEMREMITHAELLVQKKQWNSCLKLTRKALAFAWKRDLFTAYLDVSVIEHRCLQELRQLDRFKEYISKAALKEKKVLEKYNNFQEYRQLAYNSYILTSITAQFKSKKGLSAKVFGNSPVMKGDGYALSDKALVFHYHQKDIYHSTREEAKQGIECLQKLCAFIRRDPERLRQYIRPYLFAQGNIVLHFFKTASFKRTLSHIKGIRSIPPSLLLDNDDVMLTYYNNLVYLFMVHARFEESKEWIAEVGDWIGSLKNKTNHIYNLLSVYYILAYLEFGNSEFRKALKWLNLIEEEHQGNVREDIYCYSRVLAVLIQYELGRDEVLPYQSRSVARLLRSRDKMQGIELALFRFFEKKLPKLNNRKERIEGFKDLQAKFIELRAQKKEQDIWEYFDYNSWCESKINGRSFAEVTREKN